MSADKFAVRSPADTAVLVRDYPFAWVVSGGAGELSATSLPLRPVLIEGRLDRLVGHFVRSNPQVEALRREGRALILYRGPHGYISPSWMADRTHAPTWNHASAQFVADIEFFEDPADIDAHLRDLVDAMEAHRPGAWRIEDMGERYRSLARRVIGFTARIREIRAQFKLGQDERDDVFGDIVRALGREGPPALLEWMMAFNQHRPGRIQD